MATKTQTLKRRSDVTKEVNRQAELAAGAFKDLLLALRTRQPEAEKAKRFEAFAEALRPLMAKPAR